jgi:hypothetical protein
MDGPIKKYLGLAVLLLSFIFVTSYALGQQESSPGSPMSSGKVEEQFTGTWKLVSFEQVKANGEVSYPMGPDADGWIMYDGKGHMCVQLTRANRPKFASNNFLGGTPEEIKSAFEGYFAYCGTYEVNEKEGFVVHHLKLSMYPNWIGTDQKRFFEFSGDRLTLKTPPFQQAGEQLILRLVWERLK